MCYNPTFCYREPVGKRSWTISTMTPQGKLLPATVPARCPAVRCRVRTPVPARGRRLLKLQEKREGLLEEIVGGVTDGE